MEDINHLITENLDIWTQAIQKKSATGRGSNKKYTLYGIKKLRELILDLAVRGKLVPQDPKDEPASELLKRIETEKEQLIKDGKIKKSKKLAEIAEEEKPFELPEGWEWVRLGDTGIGFTGKTPKTNDPSNFDGEIPFIGPGQISPSGYFKEAERFLTLKGLEESTEAIKGDILMVCIGGSIGKNIIADSRISFNQQINSIRPIYNNSIYLMCAVSSPHFIGKILELSYGLATPIISRFKWENLCVPIPPLFEQQRIVSKVNELMTLCDQLEQQTEESITAHKTLVETLLDTLTNSKDNDELSQNWNRISDYFDLLFTTEESIDLLKQAILQLAVMGKLTGSWRLNNPNTTSREINIKNDFKNYKLIFTPRKKFIKCVDEVIFNDISVPNNWVRTQFFNLCTLQRGHDLPKDDRTEGKYVVASSGGIHGSHNEYKAEAGVVIGRSGSTGKTHFIDQKHWPLNTVLYGVDYCGNNKMFVYIFFQAFPFKNYTTSTAVPSLNRNAFLNEIISLPPLEEQVEIVVKVNELMSICDQLSNKIKLERENKVLIADAIVKSLV